MVIAAYVLVTGIAVIFLSRTHFCVMALLALGLFAISHVSPLLTISLYVSLYACFWLLLIAGLLTWFRPTKRWNRRF